MCLQFETGDVMLLRWPVVGQPVSHGRTILFSGKTRVEGVAGAVEAGAAEVVHEEVAGEGCDPGLEAALLGIEAGEILVELEEDLLGEVLGIRAGAGEAVADGVDPPVLGDDELLPGLRVAGHALANQFGEGFLRGFLFWRTLQLCL